MTSPPRTPPKLEFACLVCKRPIIAQKAWAGMEVRCPHCGSTQRVPDPDRGESTARGKLPSLSPRRYFNFVCQRCKSVLEAHTGMSGQTGHCPTCDALFVIPHVHPATGIPLSAAQVTGEGQDPTPVHAYAASGEQAPVIENDPDGVPSIRCPRCQAHSSVEANSCTRCGTPFTIEGAAVAGGWGDSRAIAAFILGLISLPAAMLFIPGLLAMMLAWSSLKDSAPGGRPTSAMVGLVLGAVSVPLGLVLWMVL